MVQSVDGGMLARMLIHASASLNVEKQKINELALHLRKTDADVSLVTVGSRSYYVYRYEGSLNALKTQ